MINKYRIIELEKPILCISRFRGKTINKYSLQKQRQFLWWKWWKSINIYTTFENAKKAVLDLKKKDANNWKDVVVWTDES